MKHPMVILNEIRNRLSEYAKDEQFKHHAASFERAIISSTRSDFTANPISAVCLSIRGNSGNFYVTDWNACQCVHATKGRKIDGESLHICWHIAFVRAWIAEYAAMEASETQHE